MRSSFYKYRYPQLFPTNLLFIYFMYSNRLNALKIGVGQFGRIEEFQNSEHINLENGRRESSFWRVLKVGRFSYLEEKSIDARPKYLSAEKNVLTYWNQELGLLPHLTSERIGFKKGTLDKIGGASETVKLGSVCEYETWSRVVNTEGYLGHRYPVMFLDLAPISRRKLRCPDKGHSHNHS